MCIKSVIKRIAPFFLTFAVGLFIASFFVSVAAPNLQFRRGGINKHREMDRQMRVENDRLRQENERLNKRLAEMEKRDWVLGEVEIPMPPEPPKVKVMPMETVPYKAR